MLCFFNTHGKCRQRASRTPSLSPWGERNAAAEDLHIKPPRCCQRKNSSIPWTCLPPSVILSLGHAQAQPELIAGSPWGTQFHSPPITGEAQLLWWLLIRSVASAGKPLKESSSRAIAYGDAMERSGSDKMTLRVWHCRLPQNHIKMTRSYQI